ncbi:MAG: ribonuclease HII [Deltaproteobacteria bacterium]
MSRPSLADLKRRYVDEARPLPARIKRQLEDDPRRGAEAILAAVARRQRANRAEGQRLRRMLRYERTLWDDGCTYVAGVDEAGMSPLAGPVVAAAVILAPGTRIAQVDDSKKLDAATRDRLAEEIKQVAVAWGTGRADPREIDTINIYHAGLLAMRRAVEALGVAPGHLLVDARKVPEVTAPQTAIIGGDGKSLSIAAASILAKTTRDAIMDALDAAHPEYGFCRHKGYGVPEHQRALVRYGALPEHRRSFAAVQKVVQKVVGG